VSDKSVVMMADVSTPETFDLVEESTSIVHSESNTHTKVAQDGEDDTFGLMEETTDKAVATLMSVVTPEASVSTASSSSSTASTTQDTMDEWLTESTLADANVVMEEATFNQQVSVEPSFTRTVSDVTLDNTLSASEEKDKVRAEEEEEEEDDEDEEEENEEKEEESEQTMPSAEYAAHHLQLADYVPCIHLMHLDEWYPMFQADPSLEQDVFFNDEDSLSLYFDTLDHFVQALKKEYSMEDRELTLEFPQLELLFTEASRYRFI
jgi:hypothetical protein